MTRDHDEPRRPRTDDSPAEFIDRPANLPGDKTDAEPAEKPSSEDSEHADDGDR
jgi:hypothetical protein